MPDLGPYDKACGEWSMMFRRLALIFSVVAMGLALNGCTKCGPIWDDWMQQILQVGPFLARKSRLPPVVHRCVYVTGRCVTRRTWPAANAMIYCREKTGSTP